MKRARKFLSRWQNWLALLFILGYAAVAFAAPTLSPENPKEPGPFMTVGRRTEATPQPPSEKAPLGTLPHGLDVFHAIIWGARDALQFGLLVTVFSALFGVLYGAFAGVIGGRVGGLMINVADSFLAFPIISGVVFLQQLYAVTIVSLGGLYFHSERLGLVIDIAGPQTPIMWVMDHVDPLMLTLILFSWMPYARLI